MVQRITANQGMVDHAVARIQYAIELGRTDRDLRLLLDQVLCDLNAAVGTEPSEAQQLRAANLGLVEEWETEAREHRAEADELGSVPGRQISAAQYSAEALLYRRLARQLQASTEAAILP